MLNFARVSFYFYKNCLKYKEATRRKVLAFPWGIATPTLKKTASNIGLLNNEVVFTKLEHNYHKLEVPAS